ALLGALRHRVVVTHALDVAAVAGAARIGDDDVVEGALLRAAAGEADLDHGAVPVLPSRQDGEVSRQVYAMARVHGNPGGGRSPGERPPWLRRQGPCQGLHQRRVRAKAGPVDA